MTDAERGGSILVTVLHELHANGMSTAWGRRSEAVRWAVRQHWLIVVDSATRRPLTPEDTKSMGPSCVIKVRPDCNADVIIALLLEGGP